MKQPPRDEEFCGGMKQRASHKLGCRVRLAAQIHCNTEGFDKSIDGLQRGSAETAYGGYS